MNLYNINKRIKNEICYETINKISDILLLDDYKNCISVKNKIKKLNEILKKHINDNEKEKNIIQDYLLEIIPAGTKAVIRGNKFNNIIKNIILNLNLDINKFEICFEKKCNKYITSEIPDWYILEKKTYKIIIGMNQIDLWSGGHQLNRFSKYIENNIHNNKNSKLLCVICKEIEIKNEKNKIYKLFKIGFENNTLCYIKNLENIINSYFT